MRLLPLVALLACSGGSGKDDEAQPVEVSGTFRVLGFNEPIHDVVVCADDPDDCLITDDSGAFSWTLPANAEVWLSATHTDFAPLLLPFRTGDADGEPVDVMLWPIEQWQLMLQSGGANWDPGTGALLLFMRQQAEPPGVGAPDPGVADVVAELGFENARTRYFDASGDYMDGALSRSTISGMAAVFDVPTGEQTLSITPDSGQCAPRDLGWATAQPFQTDRVTQVIFSCTPN